MRIFKLCIGGLNQLKSFVSINDLDDPVCLDELLAHAINRPGTTNSRQETIDPDLFQVLMLT